MQSEGDSARPKRAPRSWSVSIWFGFGNLGFWEGQGRLAMDDGMSCRRVSIAGGGCQCERESECFLCFSGVSRHVSVDVVAFRFNGSRQLCHRQQLYDSSFVYKPFLFLFLFLFIFYDTYFINKIT